MEKVRAFLSAKPALVYHVQSNLANSFSVELDGRVTIPTLVLRDTASNCCVVSENFLRDVGFVNWEPISGCPVATSMGGTGYPIGRIRAGVMKTFLKKGTDQEMMTSPEFLVVRGRTIYDVLMGVNDMRVMIGEVLLWEGQYRYYPDFAKHGELAWYGEVPITSSEAEHPVLMTRYTGSSTPAWLSCATAVQGGPSVATPPICSGFAGLQLSPAATAIIKQEPATPAAAAVIVVKQEPEEPAQLQQPTAAAAAAEDDQMPGLMEEDEEETAARQPTTASAAAAAVAGHRRATTAAAARRFSAGPLVS